MESTEASPWNLIYEVRIKDVCFTGSLEIWLSPPARWPFLATTAPQKKTKFGGTPLRERTAVPKPLQDSGLWSKGSALPQPSSWIVNLAAESFWWDICYPAYRTKAACTSKACFLPGWELQAKFQTFLIPLHSLKEEGECHRAQILGLKGRTGRKLQWSRRQRDGRCEDTTKGCLHHK